jgi:hypothetical protein
MGDQISCWYNVNDPYDIHIGKLSKTPYIATTITVILLLGVVFGVIFLVMYSE